MGRWSIAVIVVVILVNLGLMSAPLVKAKEADPHAAPSTATVGTRSVWRATRVTQLLWTGFRLKPDGGEVLLQTSGEVELEARPGKEGAVFVLKKCRPGRRTDQLPLETRYFDSPVTRVSVKQRGGDLEIAISLRRPTTALPRKEAGPNGSWFWVLEFPATGDSRTTAVVTP